MSELLPATTMSIEALTKLRVDDELAEAWTIVKKLACFSPTITPW